MVFPTLNPGSYAEASAATLAEWDSIAQINLLALIAEEFKIEVDYEKFEDATSFESLARRIEEEAV